jgi:hypothetical protein
MKSTYRLCCRYSHSQLRLDIAALIRCHIVSHGDKAIESGHANATEMYNFLWPYTGLPRPSPKIFYHPSFPRIVGLSCPKYTSAVPVGFQIRRIRGAMALYTRRSLKSIANVPNCRRNRGRGGHHFWRRLGLKVRLFFAFSAGGIPTGKRREEISAALSSPYLIHGTRHGMRIQDHSLRRRTESTRLPTTKPAAAPNRTATVRIMTWTTSSRGPGIPGAALYARMVL